MANIRRLPPGFRFYPTDEELVEQYLKKKVLCRPLPAAIIPDVQLSRYNPWDLPAALTGLLDKERYLFNRKEARYGLGSRSRRAAGSGYWKASGKDRPILSSRSNRVVGTKKTLVFFHGRPGRGSRTNWVMDEYQISPPQQQQLQASCKGEEWVLCRVWNRARSSVSSSPTCSELSCLTTDSRSEDDDDGFSSCSSSSTT